MNPLNARLVYREHLTQREFQVLGLLRQHKTYLQIAEGLDISVNTVKYHMRSIYSKLGVDCRERALDYCKESGQSNHPT